MYTIFPYKYSIVVMSNLLTIQLQDHLKQYWLKLFCNLGTQNDEALYSHIWATMFLQCFELMHYYFIPFLLNMVVEAEVWILTYSAIFPSGNRLHLLLQGILIFLPCKCVYIFGIFHNNANVWLILTWLHELLYLLLIYCTFSWSWSV